MALAYYLQKKYGDESYKLFESGDRLGGKIKTTYENGFVIEDGPDAFVNTKPDIFELIHELGLDSQIIKPKHSNFFILHKGKLKTVPAGLGSLVPSEIWPFVKTNLISPKGKLRLARERFVKAKADQEDESLADFMERRFGKEMLQNFAEPLFTGVYGVPATELSMLATFPHFRMMEKKYGSITKAVLEQRKKMKGKKAKGSVFRSFKKGMQQLPDTLSKSLNKNQIRLNSKVESISKSNSGFDLMFEDDSVQSFSKLVITSPAHVAAGFFDQELKNYLRSIPYASSVVVSLAYPAKAFLREANATGFLIPRSERKNISACTFTTGKWDDRAPEDYVLLRAFFSEQEAGKIQNSSKQDWIDRAQQDLEDLNIIHGEYKHSWIKYWINAQPQYLRGHLEKIQALENLVSKYRGLYFAGSPYKGVGVPDCIRQAKDLSEKI